MEIGNSEIKANSIHPELNILKQFAALRFLKINPENFSENFVILLTFQ